MTTTDSVHEAKTHLSRLIEKVLAGELAAERFTELPLTVAHAALAGSLPIAHKDPFDRLLIAQARLERVPIVSNERLFDACGVERLW